MTRRRRAMVAAVRGNRSHRTLVLYLNNKPIAKVRRVACDGFEWPARTVTR